MARVATSTHAFQAPVFKWQVASKPSSTGSQDNDVAVNWQSDYDGYTAFLVACYHGNMEIGKYLLDQNALIDASLTNGRNALHLVEESHLISHDDGSSSKSSAGGKGRRV